MSKLLKRFNSFKFASIVLYYTLTAIALIELMRYYSYSVLGNITTLSDPLVFSFAVMVIGFIISGIYCFLGCVIDRIMFALFKRHTGGLCKLKPQETSVISIAACLTVGFAAWQQVSTFPEMDIAVKMLFSLPLSKIAFINSKPKDIWNSLRDLMTQSVTVWIFIFYIATELIVLMLFEKYAAYINIVLVVLGIALALHSSKRKG